MDFKNTKELLTLCQDHQLPISEIMRQRGFLVQAQFLVHFHLHNELV